MKITIAKIEEEYATLSFEELLGKGIELKVRLSKLDATRVDNLLKYLNDETVFKWREK